MRNGAIFIALQIRIGTLLITGIPRFSMIQVLLISG
nr:MAG TPA: hypothetical protein [Caudoviricetes sp.]